MRCRHGHLLAAGDIDSRGRCRICRNASAARTRLRSKGLLAPVERAYRLPWVPLEAALLAGGHKLSDVASGASVNRYRAMGIPEATADRIACEVLGLHPADIFGWDVWLAIDRKEAV